ncbi:MAG: hypothetical protein IT427_09635 [Pirellulales bacterium]|nr:hypothetical protein [Pirellulales bacterium]
MASASSPIAIEPEYAWELATLHLAQSDWSEEASLRTTFAKEITPEYLPRLKRQALMLGLDIFGTAVRNDFCLPKSFERDHEIRSMKP